MTHRTFKEPKVKNCPACGNPFRPYGIMRYCNGCKGKIASGKADTRDDLENLSTPVLWDLAVGTFNKYIRLRDKNEMCISCGKAFNKNNPIDCGHYFPGGKYSGLIFDEINCGGEHLICNRATGDGHLKGFLIGLTKRYGDAKVAELISKATYLENWKHSREELISVIIEFRRKSEKLTIKK